ncbi:glycosyltransferase [Flavobacteriaceae bacterium]|nr:glycosyltransferase [Flavobacteriaceae bacterium]
MKRNLSPIVLFVYNRPSHTKKTIEALQSNKLSKYSNLIIYADGSKDKESNENVLQVSNYLITIKGFKSVKIIRRNENYGLASNIISGVSEVLNEHNKIIVLEDDLVTSPFFLNYMNDALNAYVDDNNVGCIHGYVYPINNINSDFFIKGADCWGWATWKKSWDYFEKDGKKLLKKLKKRNLHKDTYNVKCGYIKMLKDQIYGRNNSWAVRWYFSAYLNDLYCLYPKTSYVQNIGFDGSGTNCDQDGRYQVSMQSDYVFNKVPVIENKKMKSKMIQFIFKSESFFIRFARLFKNMIN